MFRCVGAFVAQLQLPIGVTALSPVLQLQILTTSAPFVAVSPSILLYYPARFELTLVPL
jgi:hypothetical protein